LSLEKKVDDKLKLICYNFILFEKKYVIKELFGQLFFMLKTSKCGIRAFLSVLAVLIFYEKQI
jgi:hypothetical protein